MVVIVVGQDLECLYRSHLDMFKHMCVMVIIRLWSSSVVNPRRNTCSIAIELRVALLPWRLRLGSG